MHFEAHAALYDQARPPYPDALWTCLREEHLLGVGTRVLELGAGTGLATGPMLPAGAQVTAVEPGARLAARLRAHWPSAEVRVATAEAVTLPDASFDLAVAATSVHWFDLDTVLPKVHRALRPGGRFAVWRNVFGDPSMPVSTFRERVAAITARRDDQAGRHASTELDTEMWARRLIATGHFVVRRIEHFRWVIDLDTEQTRALFTTFSNWTGEEVSEAADTVHELGGVVTEHYLTPLIILDRVHR